MRFKELVKVDSKGRITIPLPIREALGIREGMTILLYADLDEKKIFLSPIPDQAKLVEISLTVTDRPGVLAEISKILADNGVDIIALKCVVIKRGEVGECTFIADLSKSLITSAGELKDLVSRHEAVIEARVSEL